MRLLRFALPFLMLAAPALAQDYPTRPVKVIVPYAAGGPIEVFGRPILERLSQRLGQQFVVETRSGAGGSVGTAVVARAPADGYTLVISTAGPILVQPYFRDVGYVPERDLRPVSRLADAVGGLFVTPSLGVKTLKDFVALVKSKPNTIAFASSGPGSITHLRLEVFQSMAGVQMVHVPYKGAGEAMVDLLADVVQVSVDPINFQHVRSGKMVPLAVLDTKRHPDFPDVPTIAEAGMPDYDVPLWYIMFAPKGVPDAIVQKLHDALAAVEQDPALQKQMMSTGFRALPGGPSPAKIEADLKHEAALYRDIFVKANIKLE